jgi:deoxyribodipyrimidine photo-lyase
VRDRLDGEATPLLSPYLRFGMISMGQAVVSALEAAASVPIGSSHEGPRRWLEELIWREYYIYIQWHFPEVLKGSYRPEFQRIEWENDASAFDAWRHGQTGFPLVDAAMRQLASTGWIHNRARMVAASFLVKDLLVDWRWGEEWFMRELIDGETGVNNGNWQWVAGTGTDAAPYFRIFNPVVQGRRHDPRGEYVRRWVPELEHVTEEYVHEPWTMDLPRQKEVRRTIGEDYPAPIVSHGVARERALQAYRAALALSKLGSAD